jgi:hypothetical protein
MNLKNEIQRDISLCIQDVGTGHEIQDLQILNLGVERRDSAPGIDSKSALNPSNLPPPHRFIRNASRSKIAPHSVLKTQTEKCLVPESRPRQQRVDIPASKQSGGCDRMSVDFFARQIFG